MCRQRSSSALRSGAHFPSSSSRGGASEARRGASCSGARPGPLGVRSRTSRCAHTNEPSVSIEKLWAKPYSPVTLNPKSVSSTTGSTVRPYMIEMYGLGEDS